MRVLDQPCLYGFFSFKMAEQVWVPLDIEIHQRIVEVFCHVTHDEIAFSEVHFSDLQPCSFSGYLKPLFTRSEDISSMLYVIKFSRILEYFGSLSGVSTACP